MQYKEFTQAHSQDLIEQISSILEIHFIGKTVIVKGKKGKVIEQVGSDGKTESDEIYKVRFEDGTVEDIPARDMEMQGDDNKKIGENEAEELVKEAAKISRLGLDRGRQEGYWLKRHVKKSHPKKSGDRLAGLMTPKEKGTEPGKLSDSVEYDESVEISERTAPLPKATAFSIVYSYAGKDHKFVTKLTNIGGKVDRKNKEVRFDFDSAAARTKFRKKNKKVLSSLNESVELDETRDRDKLIDLMNKMGGKVTSDTMTDKGRVTPKTNQAKRIYIKARKRLGLGEATKATKAEEKKIRTLQNRTAAAYAHQKTELEPGKKTEKFNRLAAQLDAMRRKKSDEK